MIATSPTDYFNYSTGCVLEESLLLRFLYHPGQNVLDIVIDYAAEVVSRAFELRAQGHDLTKAKAPMRDLRHFQLANVVSLQVEPTPTFPELTWRQYEQLILAQPQVLTGVEHSRVDDNFQMSFKLGRFGIHTVCYKSFMVETRLAESKKLGANQWEYSDSSTQESIDLFNPFPWIDKEGEHNPAGFPPIMCPFCSAVLGLWVEEMERQTCPFCGKSVGR